MADDGDNDDKSYEPTPQKLEQARQQGDIPQSRELHTLALYVGILAASIFAGKWSIEYIGSRLQAFFSNMDILSVAGNTKSLSYGLADLLLHIFIGLSPFILLMMALPLLSMLAQQSITFAPDKIMPDWSHISLTKGFHNKFGKNALVEFFKGCVKVGFIGVCVYYIALPMVKTAPALIGSDDRQLAGLLAHVWIQVLISVTAVACFIGILDFFWQRYSFMERMMMSLQELKDEMKSSEGDPHTKGQRRQLGREIAMNQSLADVPNADVVIVNPTHYAVALKWNKQAGVAPVCIAKGVDDIALAIKAKAIECKIPVRDDAPLARTLFAAIDIGEEIFEEHYRAVAAAIRFADEQRRKQKNRAYSD
jgi:flagellar biosynthesis protein FlhB